MALSLHNVLMSQNSDDSDEEDDDYVPSGGDESEDDIEDVLPDEVDTTEEPSGKRKRKSKPQKNVKSRKRKGGITLSDDDNDEASGDVEKEESPASQETDATPESEKKKVDSLWADFLSDVTPPVKKKTSASVPTSAPPCSPRLTALAKPVSKPEKVTITEIFEFAGESVEVKKEVDVNSKAAKEFAEEQQRKNQSPSSTSSTQKAEERPRMKKPDGLSAVLGKVLGKKSKLSTLEKTQLDWNNFKKDEGVEEDLDQYKRSKHGYLERQAFLQRTDLRQFEIEKGLRDVNRSHRV